MPEAELAKGAGLKEKMYEYTKPGPGRACGCGGGAMPVWGEIDELFQK